MIYQALQDTFADVRIVRRYFDLWQQNHSGEAHFVVTRFASFVAKDAGFDLQQKSLFQRKLFHGLTQPYEELPRVPDGWIEGDSGRPRPRPDGPPPSKPVEVRPLPSPPPSVPPPTASPPTASPSAAPVAAVSPGMLVGASPERVVFHAFAQQMIAAILAKADRHQGLLVQAVADLPVGADPNEQALFAQFQGWAETRFRSDLLPPARNPEQLRYFIHQLYLLAADLIGPMQADRLLADAAASCERLPEASKFSPQHLL